MNIVVMKFGGTSVQDPAAIGRTAAIVAGRIAQGKSPVVVVSAMAKVTDSLLRCADIAALGEKDGSVALSAELRARHHKTAAELVKDNAALAAQKWDIVLCDYLVPGLDLRDTLGAIDRLGYAGWIGCEYKPRAAVEAGLKWMRAYR